MKIKFSPKISKKNAIIDGSIFIIRYKNKYLINKKNNHLEFLSIDNFTNDESIVKSYGFESYTINLISFLKLDERIFEFYLLEVFELNNSFNKQFFEKFSELPKKNFFLLPDLSEKLVKKFLAFERPYYIYILRCDDNSLYTGIATDYIKRFEEHKLGIGAKYTKYKKPQKLEIVFSTLGKSSASKIEYFIKQFKKEKKEDLINNPQVLIDFFPYLVIVQKDN